MRWFWKLNRWYDRMEEPWRFVTGITFIIGVIKTGFFAWYFLTGDPDGSGDAGVLLLVPLILLRVYWLGHPELKRRLDLPEARVVSDGANET